MGQIDQVAAGSLVLTDNNGKQTKVLVTNTTLIQKQASVALSDLKQGETVVVSGSAGTDGSITARSVQVSPAGGVGCFGGGPGGSRTTNPTPTP
jgi:NADPH-dependent curcumin reductase CurA